jgi:hypothetical protein
MVKGGGQSSKKRKGGDRENSSTHQDDPERMTLKQKDKKVATLMGGIRKKLARIATLSGNQLRYLTVVENSRGQSYGSCSPSWAAFMHGKNGYKALLHSSFPTSACAAAAAGAIQEDPTAMVGQALDSLTRHQIRSLWCAMGWKQLTSSCQLDGLPDGLKHLKGMVLDFGLKGDGENKFTQRSTDRVGIIMGTAWQKVEDVPAYDTDNTQFISFEELLSQTPSQLSDQYPALVMEAGIGVLLASCHPTSESIFSNLLSP